MDAGSLSELLKFMTHSFGGGTDVDRPLELSLDRLEQKDWAQVGQQPDTQYPWEQPLLGCSDRSASWRMGKVCYIRM